MSQMMPPACTGFEVKLEYPPLAFLYGLSPVYVVINGTTMLARWGAQFYPAAPGRYSIICYTNYLITPKAGQNGVELDIYPNQVIRVTWRAPHLVFSKGPIRWERIAGPTTG